MGTKSARWVMPETFSFLSTRYRMGRKKAWLNTSHAEMNRRMTEAYSTPFQAPKLAPDSIHFLTKA